VVFNAIHRYYRQAFNCMRNVLETLAIAAGLAKKSDSAGH
jgi:hypothetical protein